MNFEPSFYGNIEMVISRVNQAFDGTYRAMTFAPLKIAGTHPLPAFLHPNPSALSLVLPISSNLSIDNQPDQFSLAQNYPNPFNPATSISYTLPVDAHVSLIIYNMLGQEVATLVDGELSAGEHTATWIASDVPSGMHIYRIEAGTFSAVKQLMLVK